jgi:hypothetical protein
MENPDDGTERNHMENPDDCTERHQSEGFEKLHALSVELLDLLKENMPDRTGGVKGCNFEKAHSILHKVRDILLLGWSENFSHQGPEHSHIDNRKQQRLADCTHNKEDYLTVLQSHSVKATCSTCGPWKQIFSTLRKSKMMALRNPSLWMVLLLTGRVKLLLVS